MRASHVTLPRPPIVALKHLVTRVPLRKDSPLMSYIGGAQWVLTLRALRSSDTRGGSWGQPGLSPLVRVRGSSSTSREAADGVRYTNPLAWAVCLDDATALTGAVVEGVNPSRVLLEALFQLPHSPREILL